MMMSQFFFKVLRVYFTERGDVPKNNEIFIFVEVLN